MSDQSSEKKSDHDEQEQPREGQESRNPNDAQEGVEQDKKKSEQASTPTSTHPLQSYNNPPNGQSQQSPGRLGSTHPLMFNKQPTSAKDDSTGSDQPNKPVSSHPLAAGKGFLGATAALGKGPGSSSFGGDKDQGKIGIPGRLGKTLDTFGKEPGGGIHEQGKEPKRDWTGSDHKPPLGSSSFGGDKDQGKSRLGKRLDDFGKEPGGGIHEQGKEPKRDWTGSDHKPPAGAKSSAGDRDHKAPEDTADKGTQSPQESTPGRLGATHPLLFNQQPESPKGDATGRDTPDEKPKSAHPLLYNQPQSESPKKDTKDNKDRGRGAKKPTRQDQKTPDDKEQEEEDKKDRRGQAAALGLGGLGLAAALRNKRDRNKKKEDDAKAKKKRDRDRGLAREEEPLRKPQLPASQRPDQKKKESPTDAAKKLPGLDDQKEKPDQQLGGRQKGKPAEAAESILGKKSSEEALKPPKPSKKKSACCCPCCCTSIVALVLLFAVTTCQVGGCALIGALTNPVNIINMLTFPLKKKAATFFQAATDQYLPEFAQLLASEDPNYEIEDGKMYAYLPVPFMSHVAYAEDGTQRYEGMTIKKEIGALGSVPVQDMARRYKNELISPSSKIWDDLMNNWTFEIMGNHMHDMPIEEAKGLYQDRFLGNTTISFLGNTINYLDFSDFERVLGDGFLTAHYDATNNVYCIDFERVLNQLLASTMPDEEERMEYLSCVASISESDLAALAFDPHFGTVDPDFASLTLEKRLENVQKYFTYSWANSTEFPKWNVDMDRFLSLFRDYINVFDVGLAGRIIYIAKTLPQKIFNFISVGIVKMIKQFLDMMSGTSLWDKIMYFINEVLVPLIKHFATLVYSLWGNPLNFFVQITTLLWELITSGVDGPLWENLFQGIMDMGSPFTPIIETIRNALSFANWESALRMVVPEIGLLFMLFHLFKVGAIPADVPKVMFERIQSIMIRFSPWFQGVQNPDDRVSVQDLLGIGSAFAQSAQQSASNVEAASDETLKHLTTMPESDFFNKEGGLSVKGQNIIEDIVAWFVNTILQPIRDFIEHIVNAFHQLRTMLTSLLEKLLTALTNLLGSIGQVFLKVISFFWSVLQYLLRMAFPDSQILKPLDGVSDLLEGFQANPTPLPTVAGNDIYTVPYDSTLATGWANLPILFWDRVTGKERTDPVDDPLAFADCYLSTCNLPSWAHAIPSSEPPKKVLADLGLDFSSSPDAGGVFLSTAYAAEDYLMQTTFYDNENDQWAMKLPGSSNETLPSGTKAGSGKTLVTFDEAAVALEPRDNMPDSVKNMISQILNHNTDACLTSIPNMYLCSDLAFYDPIPGSPGTSPTRPPGPLFDQCGTHNIVECANSPLVDPADYIGWCAAWVYDVFQCCGINMPNWGNAINWCAGAAGAGPDWQIVPLDQMQPGDIVSFTPGYKGWFSQQYGHVAIVTSVGATTFTVRHASRTGHFDATYDKDPAMISCIIRYVGTP